MSMKLDLEALTAVLAADPRIILAVLFGSARDGLVREGSDVDLAVLLTPPLPPREFYAFYVELTARLSTIPVLDLTDLNRANTVLAFEALCGRRLVVRDPEAVAAFASRVAREYEHDMKQASMHFAA